MTWFEEMPDAKSSSWLKRLLTSPRVYCLFIIINIISFVLIFLPLYKNYHHYEARQLVSKHNFSREIKVASNIIEISTLDLDNRFKVVYWKPEKYSKRELFLDKLKKFLTKNKIDYLIVDERSLVPNIRLHLIRNSPPEFLEIFDSVEKPRKAILFKVLKNNNH